MFRPITEVSKLTAIQGLAEAEVMKFAHSHDRIWTTIVVRPGAVATDKMIGSRTVAAMLGENWCVGIEELGIFMTHLALGGEEGNSVIENAHISRKGKELLKNI